MEYFLMWCALGVIAALVASSRGGSAGAGLLIGLLLGPIGIIVALFEGTPCPHCRSRINSKATVCPKCQRKIVVEPSAASTITPEQRSRMRKRDRLMALFFFVVIGGTLVWLFWFGGAQSGS